MNPVSRPCLNRCIPLLLLVAGLFSSASLAGDVLAREAWIRALPPGQPTTAVYLVLENRGAQPARLTGAALASVAARLTIAAAALQPILRYYGGFTRPDLPGMKADFLPIAAIAFPAVLTQLATPVGQAYVTRAMAEFGMLT